MSYENRPNAITVRELRALLDAIPAEHIDAPVLCSFDGDHGRSAIQAGFDVRVLSTRGFDFIEGSRDEAAETVIVLQAENFPT